MTAVAILVIITSIAAIVSHVAAAPVGRPRVLAIAIVVVAIALVISRASHADTTVIGYGANYSGIEQVRTLLRSIETDRPSFVYRSAGTRSLFETSTRYVEQRGPQIIVVQRTVRDRSAEQRIGRDLSVARTEIDRLRAALSTSQAQARALQENADGIVRAADERIARQARDFSAPRAVYPSITVAREIPSMPQPPQGWLVALVLACLALICKRRYTSPTVRPLELTALQKRFGAITPTTTLATCEPQETRMITMIPVAHAPAAPGHYYKLTAAEYKALPPDIQALWERIRAAATVKLTDGTCAIVHKGAMDEIASTPETWGIIVRHFHVREREVATTPVGEEWLDGWGDLVALPTEPGYETALRENTPILAPTTPDWKSEEMIDFVTGRVRIALGDDYERAFSSATQSLSDCVHESFLGGNIPATGHPDDIDEWADDYARQLIEMAEMSAE